MKNRVFYHIMVMACISCQSGGRIDVRQKPMPVSFELEKYDGKWYGDDYLKDTDDAGNSFVIGSSMTLDGGKKEIYLATEGPPPMSRIADLCTVFVMQNGQTGVFKFEDSWYNRGTGNIYFQDTTVTVEIKIEQRAESDMQIFEGEIVFRRGDGDSE